MNDNDLLKWRLCRMIEKTGDTKNVGPSAFWVGDKAEERRVYDDINAGRMHWKQAHETAKLGLKSWEEGDIKSAAEYESIAKDFYIHAIEVQLARVRPSDRIDVQRSAGKRGRPRKK